MRPPLRCRAGAKSSKYAAHMRCQRTDMGAFSRSEVCVCAVAQSLSMGSRRKPSRQTAPLNHEMRSFARQVRAGALHDG